MKNCVYRQLGMSRIIKFHEKQRKTHFILRFGKCLDGPGGGFGAPGGGFSGSRSGGKPPLLLRLKKTPPGAPKLPPVPAKP